MTGKKCWPGQAFFLAPFGEGVVKSTGRRREAAQVLPAAQILRKGFYANDRPARSTERLTRPGHLEKREPMLSLLRNWFRGARRAPAGRRPERRWRPTLEGLEDRSLPSSTTAARHAPVPQAKTSVD